jgi:FkbM family methyltransferase
VGLFSFCAAACAGQSGYILSIEPDSFLAHLIHRSSQSLKTYPCANVEVLCASVSDSTRVSKLAIAERARASNYLIDASGSPQAKGSRSLQATVTLTLDFLMDYFPAPSVLKIDVETHEVNVLRGADRLLEEVRPAIWCEVSSENSEQATTLLNKARYDLFAAATTPHPRTNRAWFHTLALPISP